jgi:hypothetical protein
MMIVRGVRRNLDPQFTIRLRPCAQIEQPRKYRKKGEKIVAGRINPRMAAGLVPLMNLQLRALEVADLETGLKKLEQDFAREQERRNKACKSLGRIEVKTGNALGRSVH